MSNIIDTLHDQKLYEIILEDKNFIEIIISNIKNRYIDIFDNNCKYYILPLLYQLLILNSQLTTEDFQFIDKIVFEYSDIHNFEIEIIWTEAIQNNHLNVAQSLMNANDINGNDLLNLSIPLRYQCIKLSLFYSGNLIQSHYEYEQIQKVLPSFLSDELLTESYKCYIAILMTSCKANELIIILKALFYSKYLSIYLQEIFQLLDISNQLLVLIQPIELFLDIFFTSIDSIIQSSTSAYWHFRCICLELCAKNKLFRIRVLTYCRQKRLFGNLCVELSIKYEDNLISLLTNETIGMIDTTKSISIHLSSHWIFKDISLSQMSNMIQYIHEKLQKPTKSDFVNALRLVMMLNVLDSNHSSLESKILHDIWEYVITHREYLQAFQSFLIIQLILFPHHLTNSEEYFLFLNKISSKYINYDDLQGYDIYFFVAISNQDEMSLRRLCVESLHLESIVDFYPSNASWNNNLLSIKEIFMKSFIQRLGYEAEAYLKSHDMTYRLYDIIINQVSFTSCLDYMYLFNIHLI